MYPHSFSLSMHFWKTGGKLTNTTFRFALGEHSPTLCILVCPPDLLSFMPWVRGPGGRPLTNSTRSAALSFNGRLLRDTRRSKMSSHYPLHYFPGRPHVGLASPLRSPRSAGQLPQSYSCSSSWVSATALSLSTFRRE